jgi:phage terminase small subunit
MAVNGLTALQKAFIAHYVECLNATQAARLAGYKSTNGSLRAIGSENLTKPYIKAEIERLLKEKGLSSEETIARLAIIARGNLVDYADIKSPDDLADHPQAYAIKKLEMKDDSLKIELDDRQKALDHFVKLHKIIENPLDDTARALKAWLEDQNAPD